MTSTPTHAAPSVVKVVGTVGDWQLTVNGADYKVKGVTYGLSNAVAANYLPDIRAMGANTVRTWGTDATTGKLLSAAHANGIKVISGIWLRHDVDYVNDTRYKTDTLNAVRRWVRALRSHPGLLMWDVGNEVLGSLPYSGATLRRQRIAYVKYVDQIATAIHAVDRNHPVASTESATGFWPYFKSHAPHIDIYGVNSYGGVCNVEEGWIAGHYTKPYLVTETGPPGYWETPKDGKVPAEPSDTEKSAAYTKAWECATSHPRVSFGATLFNYGTMDDFNGVWWGMRTGGLNRLSYYAVARLYGGARPTNTPPVISKVSVASGSTARTRGHLTVHVQAADPDGDKITYRVGLCSKYVDGNKAISSSRLTKGRDGAYRVVAPTRPGVWKVYVFAEDGHGNVGIESQPVRITASDVSGVAE